MTVQLLRTGRRRVPLNPSGPSIALWTGAWPSPHTQPPGVHYDPSQANQLITYSGIILRLAREVGGSTWLRYDRAFRQAAAVNPLLQWDKRQPDIWLAALASSNSGQLAQPGPPPSLFTPPTKRPPQVLETCRRWNRGECHSRTCRFLHKCLVCQDTGHMARDCPILRPARGGANTPGLAPPEPKRS